MIRSVSVVAVAMSVLAAALVAASVAVEMDGSTETRSDLRWRLCGIDDPQGLARLVSELRSRSLFVRESAGKELVTLLDNCSKLSWHREEPGQPSKHDPRLLCGRAAEVLEAVFEFEIPVVHATPSDSEKQFLRRLANLQMTAYSAGIRDARRDAGLDTDTMEGLRHRFQAAILESVPDKDQPGLLHSDGFRAFKELLEGWYPIGKRMDELEFIVGKPAEPLEGESPEGVEFYRYLFMHPMTGSDIVFEVDNGIIKSVSIRAGE